MSPLRKTFTAIGIFTGTALVFVFLVLYPIFQGILQDHEEILAHKQELLQIQEDERRSREFEVVSAQYVNEFSRMEALFVDSETPVAFFRFLDSTASSLGIQMEKSPGNIQEAPQDSWPSFEIRLVGEGEYLQVLSFLETLEHAPYLLEIRQLTLSQSGGAGSVEFSLSAKVFAR